MRRHLRELWRCFDSVHWAKLNSSRRAFQASHATFCRFSLFGCGASPQYLASSALMSIPTFACLTGAPWQWHESHFRSEPAEVLKDFPVLSASLRNTCTNHNNEKKRNKFPAWFRYSDPSRCYRRPWCHIIQERQRNEQKHPKTSVQSDVYRMWRKRG